MKHLPVLLGATLLLSLVACGAGTGGGPSGDPGSDPDPLDVKPSASQVIQLSDGFEFTYMPGAPIADLEWDVEVEYRTANVQAVFDFYDAELVNRGFVRTDLEQDSDEIEADYVDADGMDIELSVELEDGRVEVDLDSDDFNGPFPAGFTLTSFSGLDLPFYDADIADVEWDFNFDHPGTSLDDVFAYYDGHLIDLGWQRTEIDDGDDDEREAEYVNEGVYLELEVEEGGEVEIEVNKLRFYGN